MSHKLVHGCWYHISANFFWDIGVRFLSWECWYFWRRHDHFRRFPKNSKVFQRSPKSSEDVRSINASSLPVLFSSKIRDREEGIVIYSFYTWFSFLTWVWVNIFLEIVSSKTATAHIFQSGVRNWPASVSRRESWHGVCMGWMFESAAKGMYVPNRNIQISLIKLVKTHTQIEREHATYTLTHCHSCRLWKSL